MQLGAVPLSIAQHPVEKVSYRLGFRAVLLLLIDEKISVRGNRIGAFAGRIGNRTSKIRSQIVHAVIRGNRDALEVRVDPFVRCILDLREW